MKKITRWHRMRIIGIMTPIGIVLFSIVGGIEGFIILMIFMIISMIMRLDLKCPSCGYLIDRSRLGPVVPFPSKICRCGQDKTKDESEPLKVRNERRNNERGV